MKLVHELPGVRCCGQELGESEMVMSNGQKLDD